jgi:large subunit ribosomal protein L17
MPHRIAGRKLSRVASHRVRMLDNLAVAVLRYERVKTTEAKAKEVRGIVDGMITVAKRGDLAARRHLISQMPHEPLIVDKLMGEIAEKYADRSSGFTRTVKLGQRLGDAAPIVQIELV